MIADVTKLAWSVSQVSVMHALSTFSSCRRHIRSSNFLIRLLEFHKRKVMELGFLGNGFTLACFLNNKKVKHAVSLAALYKKDMQMSRQDGYNQGPLPCSS